MGTKNHPGTYDAHAKAHPDEPVFVLLGRDRHAPALVRMWARLRTDAGEPREVIAEAINCAMAMERFVQFTMMTSPPGFDASVAGVVIGRYPTLMDARTAVREYLRAPQAAGG